ncbi:response regulator [Candidatus Woesearchaeota archaeon]|nr:response regulator [Candidatus Woesearchaeota archaeon]
MAVILYADDLLSEDRTRNGYERMVERVGHKLITAANGQEALEILCEETIDLVYLDVSMPVMGGPAVLRELKSRGLQIPVVMCSAEPEHEVRRYVQDSGYEYVIGICDLLEADNIAKHLSEPAPTILSSDD